MQIFKKLNYFILTIYILNLLLLYTNISMFYLLIELKNSKFFSKKEHKNINKKSWHTIIYDGK